MAATISGTYTAEERRAKVYALAAWMTDGGTVSSGLEVLGLSRAALWEWTRGPEADPELANVYARAREDQAHAMADEAIAMADAAIAGKAGDVDKVRLQVDTRKWYVSKIAPRIYGDRIVHEVAPVDLRSMSAEELREIAAGRVPESRRLGSGSASEAA